MTRCPPPRARFLRWHRGAVVPISEKSAYADFSEISTCHLGRRNSHDVLNYIDAELHTYLEVLQGEHVSQGFTNAV